MTDETQKTLKPCPFCGGEARRFTLADDGFGNDGGDVIECSRCKASSHVEFGFKENLESVWNARSGIEWNAALEAAAKKLENATAPIVPSDARWRLYERSLCIDAIRAMKREPK